MTFQDYLDKTYTVASEEKEILDFLSNKELDKINIRAAKSSLQVLIENSIGKSKKILQHYNCSIIPNESRDAIKILHDCEAISDEIHSSLHGAIGFRNALIHDYMSFNSAILVDIVKNRSYLELFSFLMDNCQYRDVICKRIENYSF
ncbi:MAG: HepT-like ribonuclease domain-containing protein [Campylobacterota bacterium]|nr:HepT-like ribonuclease domain-containing protein [Campylobacterota bacterium]